MTAMDWLESMHRFWPHLVAGVDLFTALLASGHTLLHKRDSRAATLWLVTIWFLPLLGPILYVVFGVNRIRRSAISLGARKTALRLDSQNLDDAQQAGLEHLQMLAKTVSRIVTHPLVPGNKIAPLVNGDEAFPAMLAALESAKKSISLTTYIFDNDASGREFVAALGRAVERGVAVRVLIDAAGSRYSWPRVTHKLKHARIPFAMFLRSSLFAPWRVANINLRSHRKILVVDGQIAFTGGMNIRHGNVLADHPKNPVQDLHFRVEGPIVNRLQEVFADDWAFTTHENLQGDLWFPELPEAGKTIARAITDGPDADYAKLRWTLLAALAEAHTSVQIVTPYFLPDSGLITALNLAALRGVRVDIILPAKNNLPVVHWASRGMWWQVLERGCRIWLTPPPFDHSKLMIVDGQWTLIGSANWDARSLRLNFELNIESYGRAFAEKMEGILALKLKGAREVTLAEVDARGMPGKLRDAIARLFTPFL